MKDRKKVQLLFDWRQMEFFIEKLQTFLSRYVKKTWAEPGVFSSICAEVTSVTQRETQKHESQKAAVNWHSLSVK